MKLHSNSGKWALEQADLNKLTWAKGVCAAIQTCSGGTDAEAKTAVELLDKLIAKYPIPPSTRKPKEK